LNGGIFDSTFCFTASSISTHKHSSYRSILYSR
jgi:hypothetical protein